MCTLGFRVCWILDEKKGFFMSAGFYNPRSISLLLTTTTARTRCTSAVTTFWVGESLKKSVRSHGSILKYNFKVNLWTCSITLNGLIQPADSCIFLPSHFLLILFQTFSTFSFILLFVSLLDMKHDSSC